jgi:glycosyltransferase involved in cell wall biosynthesis
LNNYIKKLVIEHGGACKARNEGFKVSVGDYVSFWDADCYAAPGMSYVWNLFFKEDKTLDFVYSDFAFTDQSYPGREAPPFIDKWSMTKYNDLCSMWPIKREKVVAWDEKLEGFQDWDFWRRVLDGGAKGIYNKGFAFTTELPTRDSISGSGDPKKKVLAIREKFGDPKPSTIVHGIVYDSIAKRIAKYLNADFFYYWNQLYKTHDYRTEIAIGFHDKDIPNLMEFVKKDEKVTKILYWMGMDADAFNSASFNVVTELMPLLKENIKYHFCSDKQAKDILEKMGINAEILPLPRDSGEPDVPLPEKFKVLVYCDGGYVEFMDSIIKSMPDIEFDKLESNKPYNLADYSVIMQFTSDQRMSDGMRNALLLGRHSVSCVKEPFAGYEDITVTPQEFKKNIIKRIRELKDSPKLNTEARDYYLSLSEPDIFVKKINSLSSPVLEVVQ